MRSTAKFQQKIKQLAATAAAGILSVSAQAGLFCDWNIEHKRPYCSPACEPTWGYHETCWRRFPPTEPCANWGDHCPACSAGGNYGMQDSYGANRGGAPMNVPMSQDFQQGPGAIMMQQQPLVIQPPAGVSGQQNSGSAPVAEGWNQHNTNPIPVPPMSNSGNVQQMTPQLGGTRVFEPDPISIQPGNRPVPQNNNSLQLPAPGGRTGSGSGTGNSGLGEEQFQLPKLPDLSQARPSGYPSIHVQNQAMQYQAAQYQAAQQQAMNNQATPFFPVSQGQVQQYPQPYQSQQQQQYAQPMLQRLQQMQGVPQMQNQIPQQHRYQPQPSSMRVAPGRQSAIRGVSFSRSVRPAGQVRSANMVRNANMMQPMPQKKPSFLSKINPFSK